MKRTYKYALSVVLGVGMAASAFAQQSFVDVNDAHWAADAVNRLKITGFIQGYPDGKFNGNSNVTRYEMASLVYAVYAKLVCFNEEVEKKLKELEAKINNVKMPEPVKPAPAPEVGDIKSAISTLQREMGSMKAWGKDLSTLKTMGAKYQSELKSLGVDFDEFKKTLNSLSDRIAKLEGMGEKVRFSGDANFFISGMNEEGQKNGPLGTGILNQDGRWLQGFANGAGIDTLTVNHELGLRIQNEAGAKIPVSAEIVLGNFLSDGVNGYGDNSQIMTGTPYNDRGYGVYINRLTADLNGGNLVIGRQGIKLANYMFRRLDVNSFYTNERQDNGEFAVDGLKAAFGKNVSLFLGRLPNQLTTAGGNVQPVNLLGLNIDEVKGLTLNLLGGQASIIQFAGTGNPFNTQEVYGIDGVGFKSSKFSLTGGYGKSNSKNDGSNVPGTDVDNIRWNADLAFDLGKINVKGGYRHVEANYVAPGDWGRTSIFRNLTDVKAYNGMLSLDLSGNSSLYGMYEKGEEILGTGDYQTAGGGINFGLTSKWNAGLAYEETQFDGGAFGQAAGATSKFTTLNLGYAGSANSMVKLFWQMADFDRISYGGPAAVTAKGNFFGAQVTIKF